MNCMRVEAAGRQHAKFALALHIRSVGRAIYYAPNALSALDNFICSAEWTVIWDADSEGGSIVALFKAQSVSLRHMDYKCPDVNRPFEEPAASREKICVRYQDTALHIYQVNFACPYLFHII